MYTYIFIERQTDRQIRSECYPFITTELRVRISPRGSQGATPSRSLAPPPDQTGMQRPRPSLGAQG